MKLKKMKKILKRNDREIGGLFARTDMMIEAQKCTLEASREINNRVKVLEKISPITK